MDECFSCSELPILKCEDLRSFFKALDISRLPCASHPALVCLLYWACEDDWNDGPSLPMEKLLHCTCNDIALACYPPMAVPAWTTGETPFAPLGMLPQAELPSPSLPKWKLVFFTLRPRSFSNLACSAASVTSLGWYCCLFMVEYYGRVNPYTMEWEAKFCLRCFTASASLGLKVASSPPLVFWAVVL